MDSNSMTFGEMEELQALERKGEPSVALPEEFKSFGLHEEIEALNKTNNMFNEMADRELSRFMTDLEKAVGITDEYIASAEEVEKLINSLPEGFLDSLEVKLPSSLSVLEEWIGFEFAPDPLTGEPFTYNPENKSEILSVPELIIEKDPLVELFDTSVKFNQIIFVPPIFKEEGYSQKYIYHVFH